MRSLFLLFLLFLLLLAGCTVSKQTRYNTSGGPLPNALNVHIVPHTHNDVGWLKTVDQYFMGANNSIQHAGVQRWWRQASEDKRSRMRALHAGGQLDFVNGGWCMHDEGATTAVDMIDQTTVGHRYLKQQFNATPTVGWQIDPFGHSATQAALVSYEAGFDSTFFMRIDYQDRNQRIQDKTMQMVWRPSASLGPSAQLLAGALITGYPPPTDFCYDIFCSDAPIQDDPRLSDNNVNETVNLFVSRSDFQHENSNTWFKNLDKLIHYVNLDGRVNAFYSTPAMFTAALHSSNLTWTVKTDDFFPYGFFPHGYLTGYFTSRPSLKRYVRVGSGYLQAVKQLEAFTTRNSSLLQRFSEAMGVAQHHDAVSGSSKQHVAYDYAERISVGYADGMAVSNSALAALTQEGASGPLASFTQCPDANISVCNASATLPFVFVAYNPLPRSTLAIMRLPVLSDDIMVTDASGAPVQFDCVASPQYDTEKGGLPYTLIIQAQLPALGFSSFSVNKSANKKPQKFVPADEAVGSLTVSNGFISLVFNTTSGLLQSISNMEDGVTVAVTQSWYWYNSSVSGTNWGNKDGVNSGAYIFRPNGSEPYPVNTGSVQLTVTHNSSLLLQVSQSFAPWLNQTITVYSGQPYAEFEWIVGSIPIDDDLGKEIVSRFSSNISSDGRFYTDSNGREMQERVINHRQTWNYTVNEPVAGNYYPVSSVGFLSDSRAQLSVCVDRSQGFGSVRSGVIEAMVHRRLLYDDQLGVGEALNETEGITGYPNPSRLGPGLVVKGVHKVCVGAPPSAAKAFRTVQDSLHNPPLIAIDSSVKDTATWMKTHTTTFTGSLELPVNVHVFTLQSWDDGVLLVRLSHQFGVNEDSVLSQPVTVNLSTLLSPSLIITNITEMSLTANQAVGERDLKRLAWMTTDGGQRKDVEREEVTMFTPVVTLTPLQIRTFLLTVQ